MELNSSLIRFWWVGGLLAGLFLIILFGAFMGNDLVFTGSSDLIFWVDTLDYINNLEVLGQLIYTYYVQLLIISGLVLLVAMIGAIVLTLD